MVRNLIARNARGEAFHIVENGKVSTGAVLRYGVDTTLSVETNREGEAAERVRVTFNGTEVTAPAYRIPWPEPTNPAAQASTAKIVVEQLDAKNKATSSREGTADITDRPPVPPPATTPPPAAPAK